MNKSKKKLSSLFSAPVSIFLFSACAATTQEGKRRDENRESLTAQAISFLKNHTQETMRRDIEKHKQEGKHVSFKEIVEIYGIERSFDLEKHCSKEEIFFMKIFLEIKKELFTILEDLKKLKSAERDFEKSERITEINNSYVEFTGHAVEVFGEIKTKACKVSSDIIGKIQSETVIVF
ncbi:MAG: hypothetical protein AAF320_02850 [Myxococcota bacterium]